MIVLTFRGTCETSDWLFNLSTASNEEMMEEGKLLGLAGLAPQVSPVGNRSLPSPPARSLAAQFGYTSPSYTPPSSTNSEYVYGGYY